MTHSTDYLLPPKFTGVELDDILGTEPGYVDSFIALLSPDWYSRGDDGLIRYSAVCAAGINLVNELADLVEGRPDAKAEARDVVSQLAGSLP
ncbi:MAG: hypothetical protein ACRD96_07270, partial [Bryobacteraceae bacterium]